MPPSASCICVFVLFFVRSSALQGNSSADAITSTTSSSATSTSSDAESTTTVDLSGACYIKAWGSVAICRTDFVNRIEDKGSVGKCCLFNLLTECSRNGARKLCGDDTEYATARWLSKYHKMIDFIDCSQVDTDSFTCFWISWENYVSVFIFLVVTVILIVYVANWYAKGGIGKV